MNISKQNFTKTNLTTTDDDGVSMYLSFESTINSDSEKTASFKTIAGDDGDSSCLSELINSQYSKGNSTLEPHKTELSIMKDCAIDSASNISAICIKPQQHQHLKGFNALSSTPSKLASPLKVKFGHNKKSGQRRSEIRPDLSTVFNNLVAEFEQEVKENVLPSDDSMPSFSKASIMQLQKEKTLSPPKTAVITPKTELHFQINAGKALKIVNDMRKANDLIASPKKEFGRCQADIIKTLKALNENLMPLVQKHEIKTENNNCSPKKETTRIQAGVENTLEVINENTEPTDLKMTIQSKVKMNSAVRKTICEPNLQTNRPSRIVTGSKRGRASLANPPSLALTQRTFKSGGSGSISEEGSDIQLPPQNNINYRLKTERSVKTSEEVKTKSAAMLRKPLNVNNKAIGVGRKSIAANSQNEKRPTPRRMPAVVKTTFNCATRKASRPSLAASNTAIPKRRSVLLLQSKILQSPMSKRKKFPETESSSSGMNDGMNLRIAGGGDLGMNSPRKRVGSTTRKTMFIEKPEIVKFACTDCGASYHVKALLDSHKKTHRAASPDISKKMQRATGGTTVGNNGAGNTLNAIANHQCKYCDKIFTLERTLHIHLLEHCPKIPAAERRKLDFTELEHVRKVETPHFRAPLLARPVRKTLTSTININDPLANFPIGLRATAGGLDKKNDNELKKVERNISPNGRYTVNKQTVMAPPVHKLTKAKKNTAHTGIYRTPNKDIPCGLQGCKQSFKNVLDFTNHMLAHTTLDECLSSLNGPAQ